VKAQQQSRAILVATVPVLVAAGFATLASCSADGELATLGPMNDDGSVLPPGDGAPVDGGPDPAEPDVTDAAPPLCSVEGFCHTMVPKGEDLVSVWGDGEGLVWAVSYSGDVLCWDGTFWKLRHHTGVLTYAIWGSSATDLWIGTETGLVHAHGARPDVLVFDPVIDAPGDPTVAIKSIWGTGPDDIWAVGGAEHLDAVPAFTKSRVLHRTKTAAGAAWTSDNGLASTNIAFRSVWGSATTGVWVQGVRPDDIPELSFVTPVAHVLRRVDDASTWTSVPLPPAPQGTVAFPLASHVFGANTIGDTVWLAGILGSQDRGVWQGTSNDAGTTFTWAFTPMTSWDRLAFAYWGTAPDDLWAVGETGLVSHWDGSAWKIAILRTESVPITKPLRAVWGADSSDFWIVGREIAIHRTAAGKP